MNTIILPYKNGSRSGAALANALGVRQIRLSGSTIHRQRSKTIINWGNSGRTLPPQGLGDHRIVNHISCVGIAADKLATFDAFAGAGNVRAPEYTTENEVAQSWIEAGNKVVERHQLTGHSGAGIRIVESLDNLQGAPLYVKYIKKQDEYRVHIMAGEVIDVQRKARRSDVPDEDVNWQVRNHQNGFCYMRENVNPDADVIVQARNAIAALGLDFGAVDIIWNNRQNKAYVLEVNTACGLEGTTLERYKVAFQEYIMTGEVTPLEGYEQEDDEPLDDAFASDETYAIVSDETVTEALQTSVPPRQELTPETIRVGMRLRALRPRFYGTRLEVGDELDVTYVATRHGFQAHCLRLNTLYSFQNEHLNGEYFELVEDGVVQEEQESLPVGVPQGSVEVFWRDRQEGDYVHFRQNFFSFGAGSVGKIERVRDTIKVIHVGATIANPRDRELRPQFINQSHPVDSAQITLFRPPSNSTEDVASAPTEEAPTPLNKWLVSVDGSVNLEDGVFDTQEEAEVAVTSSEFHNLRQLGHRVEVVTL